jgi:uncharacterized Zn finger protein (UPF0148 family)
MPKVELGCPMCDKTFTGDTEEEARRKKKEHGRTHHRSK